jgi:hypothetical protein
MSPDDFKVAARPGSDTTLILTETGREPKAARSYSQNPYRDPAPRLTQFNHKRDDERSKDEEHRSNAKQGLRTYTELTHAGAIHESVNQSQ